MIKVPGEGVEPDNVGAVTDFKKNRQRKEGREKPAWLMTHSEKARRVGRVITYLGCLGVGIALGSILAAHSANNEPGSTDAFPELDQKTIAQIQSDCKNPNANPMHVTFTKDPGADHAQRTVSVQNNPISAEIERDSAKIDFDKANPGFAQGYVKFIDENGAPATSYFRVSDDEKLPNEIIFESSDFGVGKETIEKYVFPKKKASVYRGLGEIALCGQVPQNFDENKSNND